jgi:peptidoglycan/xylan/chitin deacetylase (PgdA/CDA1 family)
MPKEITNDKVLLSAEVRLASFLILLVGFLVMISSAFSKPEISAPQIYLMAPGMEEISHGDRSKKQVIFTFDGGDGDLSGSKILEVLQKHGVKGSFFLTGKFVENNQRFVKMIHGAGHEIYNHTYDHPRLTMVSNEEIADQLSKMERVLHKVVGISPRPYFRPPYGDRDERVIKNAFMSGYQSVYWTIDAMDWQESEGRTAWEVENIILSSLAPGNIYLMHLGDTITGSILDELFTEIKLQGYSIVSLKEGI